MNIRSITVFADITIPPDTDHLADLGALARRAREAYEAAGYTVQTARLATHLVADGDPLPPTKQIVTLEAACRAHGFEYLALGPVPTPELSRLPELLGATEATFATANLIDAKTGRIDGRAVRAAARVIQQAAEIEEGFGNLRFAALANVPAGTPFFPAAYHAGGAPAYALATEAADLAVDACLAAEDVADASVRLVAALEAHAERLLRVAETLQGPAFLGIDYSLAPFPTPQVSIGAALERLSGRPLGGPATLAAAAVLADALDRADYPHTGFCGLMLPVLEDSVLAQRAAEGRLRVGELLQWSAVCGTGLDTVPLPGDASTEALAALLWDVAALSARLQKPLTARLMPLPGKTTGDPVHFDFPYFADGGVLPLDGDDGAADLLGAPDTLRLAPRRPR
jgi:hypothetical protein